MVIKKINAVPKLIPILQARQWGCVALRARRTEKTRFFTFIEALKSYNWVLEKYRGAHMFQNLLVESSLKEIKWDIESRDFVKSSY